MTLSALLVQRLVRRLGALAILVALGSAGPGFAEGRMPRDCLTVEVIGKSESIHKEVTMAVSQAAQSSGAQVAEKDAIRPFRVNIPDAALAELRRRIVATQWPEKETVADDSQGVPLATMQELARYWATDYDWRKAEARLNAWPQFITNIDGLDIHFIHVRSKNPKALP